MAALESTWWYGKPVKHFLSTCPCGCGATTTIPGYGLLICEPHPEGFVILLPASAGALARLIWWLMRIACRLRPPRHRIHWVVYADDSCWRLECAYQLRACAAGLLARPCDG